MNLRVDSVAYVWTAVRILIFRPYISHPALIFKDIKILEDLNTVQLYKFIYKNTNNKVR